MPAGIIFSEELRLVVTEPADAVVHELSEAARGNRLAVVHQGEETHYVNPAIVAYVTDYAASSNAG